MTRKQIINKVASLRNGGKFNVQSDAERRTVLDVAKIQGKKVVTRRRDQGGFVVMAMPA